MGGCADGWMCGWVDVWICGCFSLGVALVCRGVNLLQRLMTERSNTKGSGVDVRMCRCADVRMVDV